MKPGCTTWRIWAAGAWSLLLAMSLAPAGAAERKPAGEAAANPRGVTVTGRVQVFSPFAGPFDLNDCEGVLVAAQPQPPLAVMEQGDKAVQNWIEAWQKTPEGEAQARIRRYRRSFTPGPDGSFRLDNVPPGKFTLHVVAYNSEAPRAAAGQPGQRAKTTVRAQTPRDFEVPAAGGAPIDLGLIAVTLPRAPRVGDPVPDFKVPTFDGKTLTLKQLSGKVVLLVFWASGSAACRAELSSLTAVFEKYGKNPHFVMLGLSLDGDIAIPREFVKRNGIGWAQSFLGDVNTDPVSKNYGVGALPAIYLVNPQGKLVVKDLRGERIDQAVSRALKFNFENQ